jgi:hypothetical protein
VVARVLTERIGADPLEVERFKQALRAILAELDDEDA